MSLREVAPVGWDITATCWGCGHVTRCWCDGGAWWCRSCFNDTHGFDPRVNIWGPLG